MKNHTVKLLLGAQAQLGEGPVWDNRRKGLWWVNINAGELHFFDRETSSDRIWQFDQPIGCAVPALDGNLIVGLKSGLARFDPQRDGPAQPTMIASPETHLRDNRWNDGKVGPDGRMVSGTMDSTEKARSGSLYSLSADGTLRVLRQNVGISNGLAWSPDGATLYFIDTPTSQVIAFDYDLKTGAIANERVIIAIPKSLGWPDGMTSDSQGRLWIALWAGSALTVWDPLKGNLLETIPIPAKNVTSCCFGGPDNNRLFVTSARVATSDEELRRWPDSGGVFEVETDAFGLITNLFGDSLPN